MGCFSDVLKKTLPPDVFGDVLEKVKHLTNDASNDVSRPALILWCPMADYSTWICPYPTVAWHLVRYEQVLQASNVLWSMSVVKLVAISPCPLSLFELSAIQLCVCFLSHLIKVP